MPDDALTLLPVLRNLPALETLSETELARIAGAAQVIYLSKGENLPLQDDLQTPFYMLISGKAVHKIVFRRGLPKERLMKAGDFCGADYVLYGLIYPQSITAQTSVLLLYFDSSTLAELITEIPGFKEGVQRVAYMSRLAQGRHFQWVGEDEIMHLVARKHPAYLLVALALPTLIGLVALFFFLGIAWAETASVRYALEWMGLLILFIALVFAGWRALDWANDYYIITDQRVVWLEEVIGLYDSRQEVPLAMVQSSQINSSFIGRLLGYGDVTAQAYLGKVIFRHVGEPYKVKAVLDKWQRLVSLRVQKSDTEAMEKIIRRKIDPPPETPPQVQPQTAVEAVQPPVQSPVQKRRGLSGFFRERMEDGDVITYRRHIYVLLTKTWGQMLLGLLVVFLIYQVVQYQLIGTITLGVAVILLAVLGLAGLGNFLWWLYRYIDWSNDIYRITSDKLIDSMKKPLGDEVTKSAPLANILSLDYERKGIIGILLNYGNVMVNVGTDKLNFIGVHDPARVQADIFNRMYISQRKKQLAEAAKQWDQVSDWLAAYHRQAEDLRKSKKESKTG
jgi:hypothetical protein